MRLFCEINIVIDVIMSKARNWFCTLNNPTDEETDNILEYDAQYILAYEERGEKCGTLHIHFYIEHKFQKSFNVMKKAFPRANIQVARGNAEHAKAYNKGVIILERGTPKRQGTRNDIKEVVELVKVCNMREIAEQTTSYQSLRTAEKMIVYFEKKRTFKPKVLWFYGETGTGKTRTAFETLCEEYGLDDVYITMDTNSWWQGYDGHKGVIIDDMRRDFSKFHVLLRLLDRYPYQVETKGGSRQLLAETIIITCPRRPEEIFVSREDINQLLRRIDEIKCFNI